MAPTRWVVGLGLILGLAAAVRPARATDTVEAWEAGATDVEFYLGYQGLGRPAADRSLAGTFVLGYGFLERFSGAFSFSGGAAECLSGAEAELGVTLFGTVLDTRHVDLDVFLTLAVGGPHLRHLVLTPMLELNLDSSPEMKGWGVYVRLWEQFAGRSVETADPMLHPVLLPATEEPPPASVTMGLLVGAYVRVRPRHQLLLELDLSFVHRGGDPGRPVELGALALGYNVQLSPRIELLTEVFVDLPGRGERVSAGVKVGFIVTIPARTEPQRVEVRPRVAPRAITSRLTSR